MGGFEIMLRLRKQMNKPSRRIWIMKSLMFTVSYEIDVGQLACIRLRTCYQKWSYLSSFENRQMCRFCFRTCLLHKKSHSRGLVPRNYIQTPFQLELRHLDRCCQVL